MKFVILTSLLLGSLFAGAAAQAHTGKNKMQFQCDNHGCTLTAVKHRHGHHHGHHRHKPSRVRFIGDVCRYRPWNNVTVCRY